MEKEGEGGREGRVQGDSLAKRVFPQGMVFLVIRVVKRGQLPSFLFYSEITDFAGNKENNFGVSLRVVVLTSFSANEHSNICLPPARTKMNASFYFCAMSKRQSTRPSPRPKVTAIQEAEIPVMP